MTNAAEERAVSFEQFEEAHSVVASEFTVEEYFIERGTPTFYVRKQPGTKQAFLKLVRKLESHGFIPVLREKDEKTVLQVIPKPPVKPSRPIINVILFLATIGTTLLTGYSLSRGLVEEGYMSNPMVGAATFTVTIMAVFGCHEMGHKLAASLHDVEATFPYFLPGPPPQLGGFGTFGAVIQQKSLAPNKDALFDIGASGPILGFIATIPVTVVGLALCPIVHEAPPGTAPIPVPLLFDLFIGALHRLGVIGSGILLIHPVAFSGWIGMIVTMINLLPTGMLDGGHIIRSLIGRKARTILTIASILILFAQGPMFYVMIMLLLFLSMYREPDPLDNVSKLSNSRKLAAITLIVIFALCLFPPQFLI